MEVVAAQLRRILDARLDAFEQLVSDLYGSTERSHYGVRQALDLIRRYPATARRQVADQWEKALDDTERVEALRSALVHLRQVAAHAEEWFVRGSEAGLPRTLVRAVDREFDELLPDAAHRRRAVITVGSATNFETYIPDLHDRLFADMALAAGAPDPPKVKFGLMQIPRIEGPRSLWRPLLVGHEVAHFALIDRPEPMARFVEVDLPGSHRGTPHPGPHEWDQPVADGSVDAALRWLEELLCDAYALRRFGPAAVAALGSFLDSLDVIDQLSATHPPGWLRLDLMISWLGPLSSPQLCSLVEPWRARRSTAPFESKWVEEFISWFTARAEAIYDALEGWPPPYDASAREAEIDWIARRMDIGTPVDSYGADADAPRLGDADVLNGAWVAWVSGSEAPIERLASKSLETIDFLRLWERAASESPEEDAQQEEIRLQRENVADAGFGGVIPAAEIRARLAEGAEGQIVVTPVPQHITGAALDVRLGNRFIVFEPSATASFDPIDPETDPRVLQGAVEKDWGEGFVLHPGELVLASLLEYISLPGDLSCLVTTRSSYGRLGLVIATAVLVHPYFQGCLTLELVNLGRVPLTLTPGERVGQLAFLRVHEPARRPQTSKYHCPTGPEFSKVRTDSDARILQHIRSFRERTRRAGDLPPAEGGASHSDLG